MGKIQFVCVWCTHLFINIFLFHFYFAHSHSCQFLSHCYRSILASFQGILNWTLVSYGQWTAVHHIQRCVNTWWRTVVPCSQDIEFTHYVWCWVFYSICIIIKMLLCKYCKHLPTSGTVAPYAAVGKYPIALSGPGAYGHISVIKL